MQRNPVLACLLALILMFGSVAQAVARHGGTAETMVTLCGGDGAAVVLLLDAKGDPAPSSHDCPHCLAATVLAVLSIPPQMPALATLGGQRLQPGPVLTLLAQETLAPSARGPPALV